MRIAVLIGALGALLLPSVARAQCPCPGAEAAPPPPNEPGWEHIDANLSASLNNALYIRASVHAFVSTEDGEPSFQGGFLTVQNRGRCPFWFGMSGVLNVGVMPGERQILPLTQHRRAGDTTPTRVDVSGVYCAATARSDESAPDAGAPEAGARALPGRYMCGVLVCCVPGTLAAAGQCTCPLNATFVAEPGNPLLGRCTCVPNATWDPDRLQCVHRHCPANMVYRGDGRAGRCECPAGLRWDPSRRGCVRDSCAGGAAWSVALNRCACPAPRAWSATARACIDPGCTGGTSYDAQAERCVCPEAAPRWDAAAARCLACPTGQVWAGAECACPDERPRWDAARRRCEPCGREQAWDGAACVCEGGRAWDGRACACPAEVPLWNADAGQCEACGSDARWIAGQRRCVPCPDGQLWSGARCEAASRRLEIELTWSGGVDLDLGLVLPDGTQLDGVSSSVQGGRYESSGNRERVTWESGAPGGTYSVCVSARTMVENMSYRVTVTYDGRELHQWNRRIRYMFADRRRCLRGLPWDTGWFTLP